MRKQSISPDLLAVELRKRIVSGIYPANSFMPSERQLAAEFEVRRNVAVAAINMLTDEGLTERTARRGTRVLTRDEKVIAVMHTSISRFYSTFELLRILGGIQDALSHLGYKYEIFSVDNSSKLKCDYSLPISTDEIIERFAGIVCLESFSCDKQILEIQSKGFPIVVANLEMDLDVSCTWVDHRKVTNEAVRMLTGFGHKRIAYLGRDPQLYFYAKALEGYRAGLEEANISYDDDLVGAIQSASPIDAYFVFRHMLNLDNPPTAVVATRDWQAEGAYRAACEKGLFVGKDISIIGYDDVSWPNENPILTTFREPCEKLGAMAVEMLVEHMSESNRGIIEKWEIESTLIFRKSAGPLF